MSTSEGQSVMVKGRIVWTSGDLFAGKIKTDYDTNAPKLNAQGEQMKEYGFGLAVSKEDLQNVAAGQPGHIWEAIHQEAGKIYPGLQVPPDFAYKYKDGEGIDHKGVPFASREGYAGHMVFALSTTIPIKYFKWENNQNIQINEGIKCGDYVNVQVGVKAHPPKGRGKSGVYLNPMAVQFIGYGAEIINAPSGDQIFGVAQPPTIPGASATPIAANPASRLVLNAVPQPAALAPAQPVAAPTPHYRVLPQNLQPAPQTAVAVPVPVPAAGVQHPQPTAIPPMAPQPVAAPMPGMAPVPGVPQ